MPALDPHGRSRPVAWVRELRPLTLPGLACGDSGDLPPRAAHPGAVHKIGFTDHTGHRFRVFLTNQPDPSPATLEARHHAQRPAPAAGRATSATAALEVAYRAHAGVEDRIPRRQGHQPCQPALQRLPRQRPLVHSGLGGADPGGLAAGAAAGW